MKLVHRIIRSCAASCLALVLAACGSGGSDGGSSVTSSYLYFEAPSTQKPANTLLVVAHVADWTGNWDHMFSEHTPDGSEVAPTGRYSAQVHP